MSCDQRGYHQNVFPRRQDTEYSGSDDIENQELHSYSHFLVQKTANVSNKRTEPKRPLPVSGLLFLKHLVGQVIKKLVLWYSTFHVSCTSEEIKAARQRRVRLWRKRESEKAGLARATRAAFIFW